MLQNPLDEILLEGERDWLDRVVSDLSNDEVKSIYADWLEERGDPRSEFLRAFLDAGKTMKRDDFPTATPGEEDEPNAWAEMLGHTLATLSAEHQASAFKETAFRLARPALRMTLVDGEDDELAVGASKIGGLPDLPPDMPWPPGGDCVAIYNDNTGGTTRLAGFMGQLNLAEIAGTYAARDAKLPTTGVLSFFCFQDWENDNPDAIGARAIWLRDEDALVRTQPPEELTEGNQVMPTQILMMQETLDLPEGYDGPWSEELHPDENGVDEILTAIRDLNFQNILGYGRSTSGGDPTPNQQSRHLIVIDNPGECRLHIQIPADQLAAGNFEAITLNFVDFD